MSIEQYYFLTAPEHTYNKNIMTDKEKKHQQDMAKLMNLLMEAEYKKDKKEFDNIALYITNKGGDVGCGYSG